MLEVDLAPPQTLAVAAQRITRIGVMVAQSHSQADGIRDYSARLVAELNDRAAIQAELFTRAFSATATSFDVPVSARFALEESDAVVVQYNPFWYAKRGFAPGLPLALARLKARHQRPTIALMVHENFIESRNWKWALMGTWQRAQLRALQRLSDIQLCSIEAWTEDLRRSAPRIPAYHLPVGSNFPDRRSCRSATRATWKIHDDRVVLCAFGMNHPGRITATMLASARAVRDRLGVVTLLNLGTGAEQRDELEPGLEVISPGFLDTDALAGTLAGADIFLGALEDGVSTRRTTMMSAMQHDLAIVGTDGELTDTLLRNARAAVRLVPVADVDAFVSAVVDLACDAEGRRQLARRGRDLYERRFSWPAVTSTLLDILESPRP